VLTPDKSRPSFNVNPEQSRERVGLNVTEHRELGCDMQNWAMPLTQLHSGHGQARPDRPYRRCETVIAQYRRQCLCAGAHIPTRRGQLCGIPSLELCAAFTSELAHGIRPGVFCEKAQRRGSHIGIVTIHPDMTGLGENIRPGRPATTTATRRGKLSFLDGALLGKQVEVASYCGGRQPQTRGEVGSGKRAILGEQLPDPVPSADLKTLRSGARPVRTPGSATLSY